jgi:hypothetical protein
MLDNLPAQLRHLILLAFPIVMGWASSEALPALQDKFPSAAVAWSLVSALLLALTPLTRQYGVGSDDI